MAKMADKPSCCSVTKDTDLVSFVFLCPCMDLLFHSCMGPAQLNLLNLSWFAEALIAADFAVSVH